MSELSNLGGSRAWPQMLASLQSWVADYYTRNDSWSYRAHRHIFDQHRGEKTEHTTLLAVPSASMR